MNQIMVVSEGLLFPHNARLDVSKYLSVISQGAMGLKVMELFVTR